MSLDDVGIPVSKSTLRITAIAHWLYRFAIFLIPLVIAFSAVAAMLVTRGPSD